MWKLADLDKVRKLNKTVFSCFHCGGGSTMGYKLAGYDVIGGVEIDKKMMDIYRENHNPKHSYLMGVKDFIEKPNESLPKELFELDILDGSPPCSSFSMAGVREKGWGIEKKFREGQSIQILDDLFFDFIKIAKKLQPKVVVSENVKGLLSGNAKFYVKKIMQEFSNAGYDTQIFLLNAAFMGVPQRRERVFFISRKKELNFNKINLEFNEKLITVEEAWSDIIEKGKDVSGSSMSKYWGKIKPGDQFSEAHFKGSLFSIRKINPKEPSPTITSAEGQIWDWRTPNLLGKLQVSRLQTFPDDFNFLNEAPKYVCGMSVPPIMMQKISEQINVQILSKYILKNN